MWTQNMVMNNISGMLDIKSRYRIKDMDAMSEVPGEVALRRELQAKCETKGGDSGLQPHVCQGARPRHGPGL